MIILAMDTATPATVVALATPSGEVLEARDQPSGEGARPSHATAVLRLAEELLATARCGWSDVERIAIGIGPGGFTGLRIGVSTARALAQAHGIAITGVSSLRALALGAAGAAEGAGVLAAIDARRGEVFAAAWSPAGDPVIAPGAYGPASLAAAIGAMAQAPLAVGDGALRYASDLREAGADVPAAASALHAMSGAALCRLGARSDELDRDLIVPDYRRDPDAKPPRLP